MPVQQEVDFDSLGTIPGTLAKEQDAKCAQDSCNQPRRNTAFQISHVLVLSRAVRHFGAPGNSCGFSKHPIRVKSRPKQPAKPKSATCDSYLNSYYRSCLRIVKNIVTDV